MSADQLAAHFPDASDQPGSEGGGLIYRTPNRQLRFGLGLLVGFDVEFRLWGRNALSLGVDYRHSLVPSSGGEDVVRELSLHAMMVFEPAPGRPTDLYR